jgi:uncharacterized membrane protein YqjE
MAKKWLLRLLALTMALVMLMCLCAWCIDPYMLYRVRDNQYLLSVLAGFFCLFHHIHKFLCRILLFY